MGVHIKTLLLLSCLLCPAPIAFSAETKTLIWKDGTKYVGEVVNGKREGRGTIIWPDGTRFVGSFKNDMRNGPATMILPDGKVLNGTFVNDRLQPASTSHVEKTGLNRQGLGVGDDVSELTNEIKTALEQTLNAWADAWSEQDAAGYLEYYDKEFHLPSRLTRRQWEILRRSRVERPANISVTLHYQHFQLMAPNMVKVVLRQFYSSNLYADESSKEFILIQRDERPWKILDERVISSDG